LAHRRAYEAGVVWMISADRIVKRHAELVPVDELVGEDLQEAGPLPNLGCPLVFASARPDDFEILPDVLNTVQSRHRAFDNLARRIANFRVHYWDASVTDDQKARSITPSTPPFEMTGPEPPRFVTEGYDWS
jgi:hypothetical protein